MTQEIDRQIQELNLKHAFVMLKGKSFILNEDIDPAFQRKLITFSSSRDFILRYPNRRIGQDRNSMTLGEVWLDHPNRRQFEGVVFQPHPPNQVQNEITDSQHFNLFQGWPVKPLKGNCNTYWSHVWEVICTQDREFYWYLRRWMAHAIQTPHELPEVAIVLQGAQGVGKDMFVRFFGQLLVSAKI